MLIFTFNNLNSIEIIKLIDSLMHIIRLTLSAFVADKDDEVFPPLSLSNDELVFLLALIELLV